MLPIKINISDKCLLKFIRNFSPPSGISIIIIFLNMNFKLIQLFNNIFLQKIN